MRANGPIGRMVDLIFLVATVGALTISLVLTASTFTRGLTALTGIPDNFVVQATVILLAAVIFCLSSYIGIDGGMQRLSKMVGWEHSPSPGWCCWSAPPSSPSTTPSTPSA